MKIVIMAPKRTISVASAGHGGSNLLIGPAAILVGQEKNRGDYGWHMSLWTEEHDGKPVWISSRLYAALGKLR